MLCSDCCCSVGGGVGGAHLDTADAVTFDDSELDVALVTPGGVPGVLDEPVVLAVLGAVADGEDGVIELGAALGGVEDTGLVGLEDHLVSLNGDSEGLLLEGGLHLSGGLGEDGEVVGDGHGGGAAGIVLAGALSLGGAREVGVGALELGLLAGLVVLVSLLLETALAAVVAEALLVASAVNELLLGEAEELTGGDVVGTLEGASGGESPAGAASALILDGGDGTGVSPVDGGGVGLGEDGGLLALAAAARVAKHVLVLGGRPVGELVVAGGPGGVGGVVLLNPVVDEGEVGKALLELTEGVDLSVELGQVAEEVEVDGHGY
mmetsp:Transcript_6621/g.9000  ORF Transcript_6621/g.9000 Transcript_6621/m.9000 type:complete len:322 (+) Transcript_6621:157-1122(+)